MTKEKSISERMQDVTRGLMDAGLVAKEDVAERYQKLDREKMGTEPIAPVNIEKSHEETQRALAEARAALEKLRTKE